jgi:hypothetical protein
LKHRGTKEQRLLITTEKSREKQRKAEVFETQRNRIDKSE